MKIFLIGMMGAGKSFWTKKLSKKLKIGGYDLDCLIESNEERTIAEIFAKDGEAYFRKTETKLLKWFIEKKAFVLATGGGTPCFNHNMEWMNQHGITIWIDESIKVLAERLQPEKAHRPLIQHLSHVALEAFLMNQLTERTPFYKQAAYHLQNEAINDASLAEIIKKYES